MKKVVSLVLSVIVFSLCFCGCAAKDSKQTRNVVELNNGNYWEYLNVSKGTTVAAAETETVLTGSIRGALEYAYYEDVVLIYEVIFRKEDEDLSNAKRYEVKVKLNAAGEADFMVDYTGAAKSLNGMGSAYAEHISELYWFRRNLDLKSVSGKVIYTI